METLEKCRKRITYHQILFSRKKSFRVILLLSMKTSLLFPPSKRTWGTWNYAALWISMSLCIPTYTMASSMINNGMSWWQAVLTIFIGNAIVLVPMLLNGHAGAKYGIPFPVFARASFGTKGCQYSGDVAGNCCLRLVWHTNMDWRRIIVSFNKGMESIAWQKLIQHHFSHKHYQ